ncbi:MAG TPA: hypothetical protein VGX02_07065 [Candidatus Eremiobacteraceae bacterium]|jgi:hypothetical protein|nr:hypothetical protein [Candidatus Eremiobacteraceae bacterium]
MSAIAEFILLPTSALQGLQEAAVPKRRLLGPPVDAYPEFLNRNGRRAVRYEWSGWVLGTLLAYLDQQHGINLASSEFDELVTFLNDKRGGAHFFLTAAQKKSYSVQLARESFSEVTLRDYFNEFNAVEEPASGRWMLDGVRCLHQALDVLDDGQVVMLEIC